MNFSDFETMRKRISVIVITLIKEATPINWYKKLSPKLLTITITDVIAAGPDSNGIAKGRLQPCHQCSLLFFSFLLLSAC